MRLSDNQLTDTLFDELGVIDDVLKSETNMGLRIFAPQYAKLEMTPEVLYDWTIPSCKRYTPNA